MKSQPRAFTKSCAPIAVFINILVSTIISDLIEQMITEKWIVNGTISKGRILQVNFPISYIHCFHNHKGFEFTYHVISHCYNYIL